MTSFWDEYWMLGKTGLVCNIFLTFIGRNDLKRNNTKLCEDNWKVLHVKENTYISTKYIRGAAFRRMCSI